MNPDLNTSFKSLDKEELDSLIYGRQSLYPRQFNGEVIDKETIKELLKYANSAPNHKRTRPWRFVVFEKEAKNELICFKKEFYLSNTEKENISQQKLDDYNLRKNKVSHIIAIVMHRDELKRVPEIEEISAVACSVQNIYLALKPLGLAGYWSTGKVTFSSEMKDYLGVEGENQIMGFFYLGKTDFNVPVTNKESVEELITWRS